MIKHTKSLLFLIFSYFLPSILCAQTAELEEKRDSTISTMFRALWIECSRMGEPADTILNYTDAEVEFYYETTAGFEDSITILDPRIAIIATIYFENNTGINRPIKQEHYLYRYLTYNLIKRWESWYSSNKQNIKYLSLVNELHKIDLDY